MQASDDLITSGLCLWNIWKSTVHISTIKLLRQHANGLFLANIYMSFYSVEPCVNTQRTFHFVC